MKTLEQLFLDSLADAYYAEKQLTKALPKMAKAATHDDLREAFESHLAETEGHMQKIEHQGRRRNDLRQQEKSDDQRRVDCRRAKS
jgi:ferritin-like metal-binding protein YciE